MFPWIGKQLREGEEEWETLLHNRIERSALVLGLELVAFAYLAKRDEGVVDAEGVVLVGVGGSLEVSVMVLWMVVGWR